jgi:CheY-like chemotaxis protein/two-component sensor histidine kinase
MVDDLLDISRVTLGKVTLKTTRVDLRAVLHSALETTRPLVDAGGHELALRLPPDPLPLDADPTRLAQVFANLINNAAKFTPPGGRIQLLVSRSGGHITVSVCDTGAGIPAPMIPLVFDMFTQVNRPGDADGIGLGLGLTLVRRLVEMHGGTVAAESPGVDQGSTFTVRLPLAEPLESPRPVTDAAPLVEPPSLRVLVVDDNVDAAESLAMLLRLRGHEARAVHSGSEALAAAAADLPDVLVLDIGLPDMDGYTIARQVRSHPTIGNSVVIAALTGWSSDEDRRKAEAAGFDRHLVKPIDIATLADVLQLAARRRALAVRHAAAAREDQGGPSPGAET